MFRATQECLKIRQVAVIRQSHLIESAGGELLGAALKLVGELVASDQQLDSQVVKQLQQDLTDCAETREDGRLSLRFDSPDQESLNRLATTLATMLVPSSSENKKQD